MLLIPRYVLRFSLMLHMLDPYFPFSSVGLRYFGEAFIGNKSLDVLRILWAVVREPKWKNKCKMLLISIYFPLCSLMLHMLDPYFPIFSNMFQMVDFGILVRFSWMFRGFGKVFVDIYLLVGDCGYIPLIVY